MPFDNEETEQELTLLDILDIFWKKKFLIIFITIIAAVLSVRYALRLPRTYKAVSRVMLSGSSSTGNVSSLSSLASALGFSTSATSTSGGGGGISLLGIMKTNSVADMIINEYDLMKLYSVDIRQTARNILVAGLATGSMAGGGGITEISYTSTSPDFAAKMVNAFVIAAQNKTQELALEEAQRRKNFFEVQLSQAQKELTEAEDAIIAYQQSKGLLSFSSQTSALLSSMNDIREKIASKKIEISSLRSYAREDNPKLKLALSQLDALNEELHRLEAEHRSGGATVRTAAFSGETIRSNIGDFPELGIEYQRYERDLRFATAKYESMFSQYETARVSELNNDISGFLILDPAEPPEIPEPLSRSRIVMMGTGAGFGFGTVLAFLIAHIQTLMKDRSTTGYDVYDDDEEDENEDDE